MKNFEYVYPKDAASIPALLSDREGESILYAGGTDALARLKEGLSEPKQIVNLKAAKELDYIKEDGSGLHIGATTLLADLIENKLAQKYPGLIEAATTIGTIQLRNMGTVGGNLCQRPRCWYFRSRHFDCIRKHGDTCFAMDGENKYHAILGGGPCYIVYPSDLAPMMIALGARVSIAGPKGNHQVALENLYVLPDQDPYHETILKPREILTEVLIPAEAKKLKGHYVKFRERESFDFAMVSVAVAASVRGTRISDVRIVLGGVAPKPWRARESERMLEGKIAADRIAEAAARAELEKAEPLEQNEYKVILAKNLMKRAVRELVSA